MRFVKPRKPRGIKLNGEESYDMCDGCYMPFCDSMAASPEYYAKIHARLKAELCPACGHNPCRCKSKLKNKTTVIVTHNNRKERRRVEKETLNCSVCGSWLKQLHAGIFLVSGDYIEEDICYMCMLEHCRKTDCNSCKYGTSKKCKHKHIKSDAEEDL